MKAVESGRRLVCVGSYTPDAAGRGIGITTYWQHTDSGELEPVGSLHIPAPSYLVFHPDLPVLYDVGELDEGTVTALAVEEGGTGSTRDKRCQAQRLSVPLVDLQAA